MSLRLVTHFQKNKRTPQGMHDVCRPLFLVRSRVSVEPISRRTGPGPIARGSTWSVSSGSEHLKYAWCGWASGLDGEVVGVCGVLLTGLPVSRPSRSVRTSSWRPGLRVPTSPWMTMELCALLYEVRSLGCAVGLVVWVSGIAHVSPGLQFDLCCRRSCWSRHQFVSTPLMKEAAK